MPAAKKETESKPAAPEQPAPAKAPAAGGDKPARSKPADTRTRAGGHVLTDDGWRIDEG